MYNVDDFVKDACIRGRSNIQIRAIASCTRWNNSQEEIENILDKSGKLWREKKVTPQRIALKIRFRKPKCQVKKRIKIKIRRKGK